MDVRRPERRHYHALEVGCARAQGHQHVHVRPEVLEHVPGAPVEAPARDELDGGGENELPPAGELPVPGAPGEERAHLPGEGEREEDRAHEDPEVLARLAGARSLFGVLVLGGGLAGGVARLLHPADEALHRGRARLVAHHRPLGREVHRGRDHPLRPVQGLLDPRRAGGAGHPPDGELHPGLGDGVAGVLDAPGDLGGGEPAGVVGHGGPLGREVHRGRDDALQPAQLLLDPSRAGGARHAPHGKLQRFVRRRLFRRHQNPLLPSRGPREGVTGSLRAPGARGGGGTPGRLWRSGRTPPRTAPGPPLPPSGLGGRT